MNKADRWSARQIEEYLAKFSVEEVVQQAINSAIREKAADPVAHIADFLEARGLEIDAADAALAAAGEPAAAPAPAVSDRIPSA